LPKSKKALNTNAELFDVLYLCAKFVYKNNLLQDVKGKEKNKRRQQGLHLEELLDKFQRPIFARLFANIHEDKL
jgi:hypothetical protein